MQIKYIIFISALLLAIAEGASKAGTTTTTTKWRLPSAQLASYSKPSGPLNCQVDSSGTTSFGYVSLTYKGSDPFIRVSANVDSQFRPNARLYVYDGAFSATNQCQNLAAVYGAVITGSPSIDLVIATDGFSKDLTFVLSGTSTATSHNEGFYAMEVTTTTNSYVGTTPESTWNFPESEFYKNETNSCASLQLGQSESVTLVSFTLPATPAVASYDLDVLFGPASPPSSLAVGFYTDTIFPDNPIQPCQDSLQVLRKGPTPLFVTLPVKNNNYQTSSLLVSSTTYDKADMAVFVRPSTTNYVASQPANFQAPEISDAYTTECTPGTAQSPWSATTFVAQQAYHVIGVQTSVSVSILLYSGDNTNSPSPCATFVAGGTGPIYAKLTAGQTYTVIVVPANPQENDFYTLSILSGTTEGEPAFTSVPSSGTIYTVTQEQTDFGTVPTEPPKTTGEVPTTGSATTTTGGTETNAPSDELDGNGTGRNMISSLLIGVIIAVIFWM